MFIYWFFFGFGSLLVPSQLGLAWGASGLSLPAFALVFAVVPLGRLVALPAWAVTRGRGLLPAVTCVYLASAALPLAFARNVWAFGGVLAVWGISRLFLNALLLTHSADRGRGVNIAAHTCGVLAGAIAGVGVETGTDGSVAMTLTALAVLGLVWLSAWFRPWDPDPESSVADAPLDHVVVPRGRMPAGALLCAMMCATVGDQALVAWTSVYGAAIGTPGLSGGLILGLAVGYAVGRGVGELLPDENSLIVGWVSVFSGVVLIVLGGASITAGIGVACAAGGVHLWSNAAISLAELRLGLRELPARGIPSVAGLLALLVTGGLCAVFRLPAALAILFTGVLCGGFAALWVVEGYEPSQT